MGINQLTLSPEQITALYPDCLVTDIKIPGTGRPESSGPPVQSPMSYPFLGGNLKQICFLVNYPAQDFLPEEVYHFLLKIMAACSFKPEDIAVVNTGRHTVNLAELRIQMKPELLFLWGVSPLDIGMKMHVFPDLEISPVDGFSLIHIHSPELIRSDQPAGLEMKKKLWSGLKKRFNL